MTEPILPCSPVPRAKMTVMFLQEALLVTSLAVLDPVVKPPPVDPPDPPPPIGNPGKDGKLKAGAAAADLFVGGKALGKAEADAAKARKRVLVKSILKANVENEMDSIADPTWDAEKLYREWMLLMRRSGTYL